MKTYLLIILSVFTVGIASAQVVEDSNQYLIELKGNGPNDLAGAVAAAGGELAHNLAEIGAVSAVSESADFAANMAATNGVKRVTRDLSVQWVPDAPGATEFGGPDTAGHLTDPESAVFRSCQWSLDQIDAGGAWANGQFGAGTTVAVLDSGVSGDPAFGGGLPHADMVGKLVGNVSMISTPSICDDFVPDMASPLDFRFHGTAVASLIGAHGVLMAGVAPDANIYGVKVLNCLGSGSFADVIAGILHAANEPGVDVINMSLGAYFPKNSPGAGPLLGAMNKAVNYAQGVKGKLVVSAAGNDGADLDHDGNFVSLPAQAGSGLSAWAGNVDGDLASYSNHGRSGAQLGAGGGGTSDSPNIPLPGCGLPAAGQGGMVTVCSPESLFFGCFAGDFVLFGGAGTSFSSPLVAGVGALAKSQYPSKNGNQLKSHLKNTADDIGANGTDNDFGHGRVNANSASQ